MKTPGLTNVRMEGGLLGQKNDLVREKVIPYQWRALNDDIADAEPSYAIKNFKIAAGEMEGDFGGMVFQDSDVAKWLEAVAYQLATHPDETLKKTADSVIDIIEKAQDDNGYLNTRFTIKDRDKRWTNLAECHELYCAGHMLEAAVAYFEATGERKLLDVMIRFVDHIGSIFGPGEGRKKGYPGHQEIELALMRLYKITGEKKHLDLARYFIDERGTQPHYFDLEYEARGKTDFWPDFYKGGKEYHQSHLPVREQKTAVGHSVRAVYMYTAMADIAARTGDESLKEACRTLWKNTTEKQMYVTAGIGSSGFQEAFTFDYDMPADRAYTETCASIGLVFWASRMLNMEKDGRYADVMERALYNGVMSGMNQDGDRFFYVNPLEVWPDACEKRKDHDHVKPIRQKWYGCACCPPNIARLFASIGEYIYSVTDQDLYVHLYNSSSVSWKGLSLKQKTEYPWNGRISMTIGGNTDTESSIYLRIPGWCQSWTVMVNGEEIKGSPEKGYLCLTGSWKEGDTIEADFAMPVERVYAHPRMRDASGKTALQRGPVVYCLEEADNGKDLPALLLAEDGIAESFEKNTLKGVVVLKAKGLREEAPADDSLYSGSRPVRSEQDLTFVPYYAWNNRKEGEMLVWIREI